MQPTDIDYINAHGTSTPLGDVAECTGVKRAFGDHAYKLAVSSTKSMTGHLLGAAGGIEAVFTVLAMRDQIAPPTVNLVNVDPDVRPRLRAAGAARKMTIRGALSNSFGFGGHQRDAGVPRARLTRRCRSARRYALAMALIVQKYGGTSVGTTDRIKNVARRVAHFHAQGHQLVVVVSAMSGETNRLLGARQGDLAPDPNPRELDVDRRHRRAGHDRPAGDRAAGAGPARRSSYTGGQVRILTDNAFTKARILEIDEANMRRDLDDGHDRHRRRLPGRRRGRQHHDARPRRLGHVGRGAGRRAQGRRVPDLHRRRRRLHDRPAHRARGAAARHRHVRGNARDGEPGLEGPADPLGRIRGQVQGQAARAVVVRRSRSPPAPARSSRSRKTTPWNRRSSPASRSTATRPRSR